MINKTCSDVHDDFVANCVNIDGKLDCSVRNFCGWVMHNGTKSTGSTLHMMSDFLDTKLLTSTAYQLQTSGQLNCSK